MNQEAINKVLTDYVIENANLKVIVEELKAQVKQLEEENKPKEGE